MIKTHIPARPRNKKIVPTGGSSIAPIVSSGGSSHSHSNKPVIDKLTQANIDVLSKLFVDESGNLYTTQNFYSQQEVSAYGIGSGGSGGGDISKLPSWAGYTPAMVDYYVSAGLLVPFYNDMQARVGAIEAGGSGGSNVTWGTESGGYIPLTVEGVSKSVALSTHTHSQYALTTHNHSGVYEPAFTKNQAFNKNFGTTSGTVAQGNDSRIVNGQTAYGWGNHASAGYALNTALTAHINKVDNPHSVTKAQVGLGNVLNVASYSKTESDTNLTSAIDNIEIGGRNLIIKSATTKGYYSELGVLLPATNTWISDFIEVSEGKEYTAKSFNSTNNVGGRLIYFDADKTYITRGEIVAEETFVIPTGVGYIRYQSDKVGGVYVNDAIIVKGNKATDWTPAPEDVEIGGRNLIKNSSEEWVTVTTSTLPYINNFFPTTVLEAEQEYTFSWEAEIVSGTPSGVVHIGCGTTDYQRDILYSNAPIVGNNKVIFKPTSANLDPYKSFAFRWFNNGAVFTFRYRKLKLEKGYNATDWTPAPEDQVSDWSTTDVASFSYIKNKPTTLAGYGITDAVTLNTTQTITGAKTFDSNIILGINRNIQGTDNYTGVWNVDNLLWRFGSSNVGSVANIRSEKVGIGTDNPLYKLDVSGTGRFTDNVTAPTITASTSVTTPKVIFAAAGWSLEQVGTELQMKYNGTAKMRFLSGGSIVATQEITAYS